MLRRVVTTTKSNSWFNKAVFVPSVTYSPSTIQRSLQLRSKAWKIFSRSEKKSQRVPDSQTRWQSLSLKLKVPTRLKICSNTLTTTSTKSVSRFLRPTLVSKRKKKWLDLHHKWKELHSDSEWISNNLLEDLISLSPKPDKCTAIRNELVCGNALFNNKVISPR